MMSSFLQRGLLAAATTLALAAPAQASLDNGDFSAGLSGWQALGDVGATSGVAQLSTLDGAALDAGVLASALGLGHVTALDQGGYEAYEGSGLVQSFSSVAGQTLSFQWAFDSDETSASPQFRDYAFVLLDGQLLRLGGVGDSASWQSRSFALGAGQHTVAFGIVDLGDYAYDSRLSLSGVVLSAVPEPQPMTLVLAGLGLLALRRRRVR
jgi:MYXO-CTERM domain-containing protein